MTASTFAAGGSSSASTSGLVMEILAKKGIDVAGMSTHASESEILLGHNSRYKVVGVKHVQYQDYYTGANTVRQVVQLEQVTHTTGKTATPVTETSTGPKATPSTSQPQTAQPEKKKSVADILKSWITG